MSEKDSKKPNYSEQLFTSYGTKKDNEKLIQDLLTDLRVTNQKYESMSLSRLYTRQTQAKKMTSSYAGVKSGDIPLDGDLYNGSKIFVMNCISCHSLERNSQGIKTTGPGLGMIYGRKAGADPFFEYSEGLVKAQFLWSEKRLFDYLRSPQEMIKGVKCEIPNGGIQKEGDRSDLTKFLKKFTKELMKFVRIQTERVHGREYVENQILTRMDMKKRDGK